MKIRRGTKQAATILVALIITLMLTACGIHYYKLNIEVKFHIDKQETEIQNGLPQQNQTLKKQKTLQQNRLANEPQKHLTATNARRNKTIKK